MVVVAAAAFAVVSYAFCFGLFCLAFALCFHFVFLRIFCFRFVSFGTVAAAVVQQHPLPLSEWKRERGSEGERE